MMRTFAPTGPLGLLVPAMMLEAAASRWNQASMLHHAICQGSVERADLDDLVVAMRCQLERTCPTNAILAIDQCADRLPAFEAAVQAALDEAIRRILGDPKVKALYCEYFYDGSDSSSADLFLCHSFRRNDDSWASDFRGEEVVPGPGIRDLLNFDPELLLEPCASFVAGAYAHVLLLRAFAKVACCTHTELPIGFAQHDDRIIYL